MTRALKELIHHSSQLRRPFICPTCLSRARCAKRPQSLLDTAQTRWNSNLTREVPIVPLRKQLKDEARKRRLDSEKELSKSKTGRAPELEKWELTVGIEIHAELNTEHKLFSRAATSLVDTPNTHVSFFDLALPGSQPQFQRATLLPALRAAIALHCDIQRKSSFDRKHYFYHDQPNGYQITQYYEPFAKDGYITLYDHDGIDPADSPSITVGIKQIQMEQDTAKTVHQPPETYLLDFNRVSHPLIEIITLPQIHHPATAAALVRKVQSILKAVSANTTGMEMGGLRADVNVSVRRRDARESEERASSGFAYAGVTGLGQRTEIKNLNSFKAVEDAIVAERDRQIGVLESGGVIEGETRGWTLGSTETRKLRGKEGEVDYRYMPDPDLGPVLIAEDLIKHLTDTLPMLPDDCTEMLTSADFGLTLKDAKTLVALEDGERLEYYLDVRQRTLDDLASNAGHVSLAKLSITIANSVLHLWDDMRGTAPDKAAHIFVYLLTDKITNPSAVRLFSLSQSNDRAVKDVIDEAGLWKLEMGDAEYSDLAKVTLDTHAEAAASRFSANKQEAKGMWLVGQMLRANKGLDPKRAKKAIWDVLNL